MATTRKSLKFDTTTLLLARLRGGFTQESLARELQVTMRTVQHWEGGTGVPSGSNLLALADLLNLSTADLWRDERDEVAA